MKKIALIAMMACASAAFADDGGMGGGRLGGRGMRGGGMPPEGAMPMDGMGPGGRMVTLH